MSSLLLRFAGPLQSWGSSGFAVRNTETVPTRSGVVGLLKCALGLGRNDPEPTWLAELDIWVRVEKAGRQEEDFHTVNPPAPDIAAARARIKHLRTGKAGEADYIVTTASGACWKSGKRPGPLVTAMISYRRYLADAEFLIAVGHDDVDVVNQLVSATRRPVFMTYLGRKTCAPAFPYHLGVHDADPHTLLTELPTLAAAGNAQPLHHILASRNPMSDRTIAPVAASTATLWKAWMNA